MIPRFGKKHSLQTCVIPLVFYLCISFLLYMISRPHLTLPEGKWIAAFGIFAIWRYGWQILNYCRASYYAFFRYPYLRMLTQQQPKEECFPEHIFFVIPSFKEEGWVSVETFQSILSNIASIPSSATLIVATGSDEDDAIITATFSAHPCHYKAELVLQRQNQGKRIAMGHALRAVARRYKDEFNSVTLFMDGDSYLEPKTLIKSLPFFTTFKDLGALTTNEVAFINTRSSWYKDWFNLKFGQRHILFQSHSLSNKVLTLTGRFSMFRTCIVTEPEFIQQMEHDILSHWAHGKFRFLMGDDKTSWFYLLKRQWNMLYIPDVLVYSLESRDTNFWQLSTSLPFRWYGNSLRNNARSLALGMRTTGVFIWFAILDQRLSMWSALVGITGATLLSIFKNPWYLPLYLGWVLIVRVLQMLIIALRGHPVSLLTIPLMLYNQWVGSIIKIRAYFNLGEQRWSKGGTVQKGDDNRLPIQHRFSRYLPRYLQWFYYSLFVFSLALFTHAVDAPNLNLLASKQDSFSPIKAEDYGVIANDNNDDSTALNALIAQAPNYSVIALPEGTLNLYQPVQITRSHITLKGNNTNFVAQFKSKLPIGAFSIKGEKLPKRWPISSFKTNKTIVLNSSLIKLLNVGDTIFLSQPNTDDFLQIIGSTSWNKRYPLLRRQLNSITKINGDQVFLSHPLPTELQNKNVFIQRVNAIENVELSNFKYHFTIPNGQAEEVRHVYRNLYPEYLVDTISLEWTNNIRLNTLSLHNAGNHPLSIENSLALEANNIRIDGAWNKGEKGRGYLKLAMSHYCKLNQLRVSNIRHITIQWGSSHNLIYGLYSEVDINFHGGFSQFNKVKNASFSIPIDHPWPAIYRTPDDAKWAPPDGEGNEVEPFTIHTKLENQ